MVKKKEYFVKDEFIENCRWELKCPVAISKIQRTASPNVDYCTVCNQNVYLVTNTEQLKDRVAQKQCVVIDFESSISQHRTSSRMLRGKISSDRF